MNEFVPAAIHLVNTSEQIKAFGDPLRTRVLSILSRRAATNQQIAEELGEPQAKVLYHVRFLLEVGLIQQVETRVKGGNVEKYYRAIAFVFDLRPPESQTVDDNVALLDAALFNLRWRVLDTVRRFSEDEHTAVYMHTAKAWITRERFDEFNEKVRALMLEYFDPRTESSPDTFEARFATFIYKDPGTGSGTDPDTGATTASAAEPDHTTE